MKFVNDKKTTSPKFERDFDKRLLINRTTGNWLHPNSVDREQLYSFCVEVEGEKFTLNAIMEILEPSPIPEPIRWQIVRVWRTDALKPPWKLTGNQISEISSLLKEYGSGLDQYEQSVEVVFTTTNLTK